MRDDPHAEGAVAEDGRAKGDPPGNHRRVVVVAPVEVARPQEIVGLIGTEFEDGGSDETDDDERQDGEAHPDKAGRLPCRLGSDA